MADIDWRSILVKYITVVVDNEGVDFLYDHEWTLEEWQAIQSISGDIDALLVAKREEARKHYVS